MDKIIELLIASNLFKNIENKEEEITEKKDEIIKLLNKNIENIKLEELKNKLKELKNKLKELKKEKIKIDLINFLKKWLIYILAILYSCFALFIILDKAFWLNFLNDISSISWIFTNIWIIIFLLAFVSLVSEWEKNIESTNELKWEIFNIIKNNDIKSYNDLYEKLGAESDKDKKRIRIYARQLKNQSIIDFKYWWKDFSIK